MESPCRSRLWGIILAGGNGVRLRNFSRMFHRDERPKQYCTFIGTRSMLRHTYDRATLAIEPERILTLVSRRHRAYVAESLPDIHRSMIVEQPFCRETAASVLLSLMHVVRRDPGSISVIFPSDHFVLDEWKLAASVSAAAAFVEKNTETFALLGVRPTGDDRGYGWMVQGTDEQSKEFGTVYRVESFHEKPGPRLLSRLDRNRSFWNTMILVARTEALVSAIFEHLADWKEPFDVLRGSLGSPFETAAIEHAYGLIEPANFSSAVLAQIPSRLRVMDISDTGWSDWGEEHRIREDAVRFDLSLNIAAGRERSMYQPWIRAL